jgi:hypothetical protein
MSGQNENWEGYSTGHDPQQMQESKGGCWKYGAIGCLVILFLMIIGGFIAYRVTMKFVSEVTEEYTSDFPMDLPAVAASETEINSVLERVGIFGNTLHEEKNPSPLVLNSRDINILINNHPDWKNLEGLANVTIEGDQLKGKISIPLEEFSSVFEGKYLNGEAVIRVGMEKGTPFLVIDSVEVGGKELPGEFMSGLRTQNMWEESYKNPETHAVLEKLESIVVRDGKLVISPKGFGD